MPWLLHVICVLVIVGLLLWIVEQIPMDATIARIIRVVVNCGGLPVSAATAGQCVWRRVVTASGKDSMRNPFILAGPDRRGAMLSRSAAKSALALVLATVLFLTACQPSTLISALDAVVTAAEIALPVIGATAGIPPIVMSGIVSYLQAVDVAINQTSVILAGPGTSAEKAAQILAAFAGIAAGCNCIPPGTPQAVVSVINAVAEAVGKFLTHFSQPSITAAAAQPIKIGRADRAALAKIRTRAQQNMSKLKDLKK